MDHASNFQGSIGLQAGEMEVCDSEDKGENTLDPSGSACMEGGLKGAAEKAWDSTGQTGWMEPEPGPACGANIGWHGCGCLG